MSLSDVFALMLHGLLALLGGAVREIYKIGREHFIMIEFIGGVLVSMFSGIVVFFICRHFVLDMWLTAALTSIGGYSGPQALDLFVSILKKKIKKL
ncbi:MAG: phage holin family protein [Oscillospiraceae bacterium]|jgi:hypothetical protein|nr:phage holin family protein [Oscillospiraceae bacterium]